MTLVAARPWIIMALIFLLGAITGSLLTIGFGPEPRPPGEMEIRNHWMHRLTERLHLTEDQQTKIQPIVTDAETNIQSAHHEDVDRISTILKEANDKIRSVLTPDQQAELAKMDAEREKMFNGHMHGGHGPGDFHHHDGNHPPGTNDHPPGAPPVMDDEGH